MKFKLSLKSNMIKRPITLNKAMIKFAASFLLIQAISTQFVFSQNDLDSAAIAAVTNSTRFKNTGIITKLELPMVPDGFKIAFIGSDNKVVIDSFKNIHEPLVDKKLNLLYRLTRISDSAVWEMPEKDVVVKGIYSSEGHNAKPFVIPALREWYGLKGRYQLTNATRIVVESTEKALKDAAILLQEDLYKTQKRKYNIVMGKPQLHDIFLSKNASKQLGREGYELEIKNVFTIKASQYPGLVFGTRTLLQLLENNKANAIQQGLCRDYPTYEVRSFMLDVGRKYFTMDFLKNYVRFMSYYKMSEFHIHLNDNGFKKYFNNNWDSTYAAFRLENTRYPTLTARDGFYTKVEYRALQKMARRYGIKIISEIDVPAHTLAFSHAVPEVGSSKYGMDHLDLYNNKTYEMVKDVLDEYIAGPDPVFIEDEVHIGTDEYDKRESEKFRYFTDYVIRHVQSRGKKVRAWGSLTHAQGITPVTVNNVKLNIWYNGYAEPVAMKKLGYPLISTPDGWLYIVPAAGYYYDYLNIKNLYEKWEPVMIGKEQFHKGDPLILGGTFAVWNDIAGNGISQKDVHHRVFPAMQTLSEKMWGGAENATDFIQFNTKRQTLKEAPGLNMLGKYPSKDSLVLHYSFDRNSTSKNKPLKNTAVSVTKGVKGEAALFNKNNSTIELPVEEIGYNYTVSFWIRGTKSTNKKNILFQSNEAFVSADKSGKGLGFEREAYPYFFDYRLPQNEWVHITITGDNISTHLFVNGKPTRELAPYNLVMPDKEPNGKEISFKKIQTLVFPLRTIGSKEGSFQGAIDELKVFNILLNQQDIERNATL
jgi:hexosaminidase